MILALSPLASHALVWGLCSLVAAAGWISYRREQIRALDLHDGTEPDVDVLFELFRDVDDA